MNEPQRATTLASVLALIALGGFGGQPARAGGEEAPTAIVREAKASAVAIEGEVLASSRPVADAIVYAYELATYDLVKVLTDKEGRFRFASLPAGMYKIIAYKDGFAPTIALLLRPKAEDRHQVEIHMRDEEVGEVREAENYWSVRGRVPADVLRDIQRSWIRTESALEPGMRIAGFTGFEGDLLAQGGVESLGVLGEAQMTSAEFDLRGAVGELQVDINGYYRQLVPDQSRFAGPMPDGQARSVAIVLESPHQSKLSVASSAGQVTSANGALTPVDLEHYQMQWSGRTGERGRSDVMAQYTEEANYHRSGWVNPVAIPESSRTWNLQGDYAAELTERTSLKAGLTYQQRSGPGTYFASFSAGSPDPLIDETIGVYGLADSKIMPRVVVEYGLYSSMRGGNLSLMPHGGMVVDLGSNWQARTAFARRVKDGEPDPTYHGFSTAFYTDSNACREAGEACYEVLFSRGEGDDTISVGAVHREFAETLQLYFSPDFFDRLESLFVVEGDELPELQFSMVRRIAPKVLARLESNIAAGGGGIFYATDDIPYENQVRYLVTSLDTRFQQTSTGVFVAFHHLEQELNPVLDQPDRSGSGVEMQRLQLMLTQDLNVLADFASNWAVRFNVELSRGATPYTLTPSDDLHKKLTGGISISF